LDWDTHFQRVSARQSASFGADFGVDPNVLAVQHALNIKGVHPTLKEDGIYGNATRTALLYFQRITGLAQNGRLDPPTLKKLGIVPKKLPALATVPLAPIAGIKQVVVDSFPAYTIPFEGNTDWPYTDIKGLVSTGDGNLIDPLPLALELPWTLLDGKTPASPAQVTADFNTLKANYAAKKAAGLPPPSAYEQRGLTQIRLPQVAIGDLMAKKLRGNHSVLQSQYPSIASWPADAQMAMHSLSWAWGPSFASVWNKIIPGSGDAFKQAVNASPPNFAQAGEIAKGPGDYEVTKNGNSGLAPRNDAQDKLFQNAHAVVTGNADPNSLFYPNDFWTGLGMAVLAAPSQALAFAGKHVGITVGSIALLAAGGVVLLMLSSQRREARA
jgi:peptidoglycan hydrolase-like protein with peptidoglycan-binding domain